MNMLIIFGAKYLLVVSAALAVFYFSKETRQRQKEMLFLVVIIFPLSYVVAKIIGHFYFDPRPFVIGHFTPLIPHAPDNGFSSDHTLLGAALAAVVFRFNKKMGYLLFSLALLVGLARVLAGVHHSVDILGSIAIVWAVYLITDRFFRYLRQAK